KKVSGRGGVEVLSFIVEDDISGFKNEYDYFHIPFYISNILVLNSDGNYVKLDDHIAYLDISKNTNQHVLNPNDLVVYPNPATDYLNMHLNGSNELKSVTVFSLDGTMLKNIQLVDKKHQLLDLQELQNGLYLLKVETNLGPITKKIEIIR
ncbi:MAG: T9SS type A sorting domain-containing protein, partial [Saprospiraceae bacterium]